MKYLFLLVVLFVNTFLFGQSFNKAKMDSFFTLIETHNKGMGSVSIFQSGEEVYKRSLGMASTEKNMPANENTKYRIGSISKMFTAAIIMQLVEENKLQLDTKLSEFYPEIKNASRISIAQMLKHQSGIYNFTNSSEYINWMEKPITRQALLKKITKDKSVFEPGTKTEYSNTNYVLLSMIAEKVTGESFDMLVKSKVTASCNLINTQYGSKISLQNNEAQSYYCIGERKRATETDMSVPIGAGAMISTPTDLNKFINCFFGSKLFSETTLKKMMEIEKGFGMGLFQAPFYDKVTYGHTGGIDGFSSQTFYFPKEDIAISYISNCTVMPVNDIVVGALNIYFEKPFMLPEFKAPIAVSTDILDKYTGIYSDAGFPLKISIKRKGDQLIAQATGQPSFPLEAVKENVFKFDPASLEIEFVADKNQLILRQGGGVYYLTKE